MIDWEFDINNLAPSRYNQVSYLEKVTEIISPIMEFFCNRLSEINNWNLEDANRIFLEIIEELPIMTPEIYNGEFRIRYNTYVYIKLNTKKIYRELKIKEILK